MAERGAPNGGKGAPNGGKGAPARMSLGATPNYSCHIIIKRARIMRRHVALGGAGPPQSRAEVLCAGCLHDCDDNQINVLVMQ